MKTEFAFTLPRGYLDPEGRVHGDGVMRLATARDEIELLGEPQTTVNHAYLSIALLSRVVTRLGLLSPVPPAVIEDLFASDFTYLQELYLRLNDGHPQAETACPSCGTRFALDLIGDDGT